MRSPLVFEVHPTFPPATVTEFVAFAKENPGRLTIGSFGAGSISHLTAELFKKATGIDALHVPYRGSAPLVTDLVAGQVQSAFDNLPVSIEQIRAGKLRPLAVTTAERSEAVPNVPTMGEFIAGFEASATIGVAVPKNTPGEIIQVLNREINAGLADPRIKARLAELSAAPVSSLPSDYADFFVKETDKWGRLIREAGIKME